MSELLAKLNNDPEAAEADVQAYLAERATEGAEEGLTVMPAGQFWQPGDLDKFRALRDWWPHDAPPALGRPFLGVLCRGVALHASLGAPRPFGQELEHMWRRACAWLETEDRDLTHPNETREERRRRKGREAVARHRARAASGDPAVSEVSRLHAEYIAACQARSGRDVPQAARCG